MKRFMLYAVLATLMGAWTAEFAMAGQPLRLRQRASYHSSMSAWHGNYYSPAWGMPVAVVAPPTSEFQTNWGWGVGNTRVTRIWHQFGRDYPGPSTYERGMFQPTPAWPSDTDQFGFYYVRGPW